MASQYICSGHLGWWDFGGLPLRASVCVCFCPERVVGVGLEWFSGGVVVVLCFSVLVYPGRPPGGHLLGRLLLGHF